MNQQDVLDILGQAGAIIADSHIVYTSGRHGNAYVNKDAVYPDTETISSLCEAMASFCRTIPIEVVAGPALGGIILSQWTCHHLRRITGQRILSVYAEKETIGIPDPEGLGRKVFVETGKFVFNRGYADLVRGRRVLVVEDVLNTGVSVLHVVEAVRAIGGHVAVVSALCNRGGVTQEAVGSPEFLTALVNIQMDSWPEDDCPLCRNGVPVNTQVGKGRQFLDRQQG